MIHEFLVWLGWYADRAIQPGGVAFWSYPLGLFCSASITVYSFARVIHPHYKADWLDTVYNALNGLLFLLAFSSGLTGEIPHYVVKTWLLMYASRCILRGLVDWYTGNEKAR